MTRSSERDEGEAPGISSHSSLHPVHWIRVVGFCRTDAVHPSQALSRSKSFSRQRRRPHPGDRRSSICGDADWDAACQPPGAVNAVIHGRSFLAAAAASFKVQMHFRNSLLIATIATVSFGCARRQTIDYCNAASLNKVVVRPASQLSGSPFGDFVFEVRAVEEPHSALSSALIVLSGDSAVASKPDSLRTDAAGKGTFTNLAPGRYRLVTRLIGRHSIVNSPLTVRAGAADTVDLLMAPAPICENWPAVSQPE